MRILRNVAAAMALASTAAAASAQSARSCITTSEAEGMVLFAMPEIVRAVGATCTRSLPPRAILRRPQAIISKFAAEGESAWPRARAAFGKIAGPDARSLLEGNLGRPLLSSMVGPLVAGEVKSSDCTAINRIIELSQPLPARNTAGLFVTILQLAMAKDTATRRKLPLCPLTP